MTGRRIHEPAVTIEIRVSAGGDPRGILQHWPTSTTHIGAVIGLLASSLASRGPVRLTVHDITGRQVASLLDGGLGAGEHVVTWDGVDEAGARLAAGVYFARLATEMRASGIRLVVTR